MAEAAGAVTDATLPGRTLARAAGEIGVRLYVEYDVVRMSTTGNSSDSPELIKLETASDSPGDHMVSAGCVTADAEATHPAAVLVECKTATEDVHPTDALANHGIPRRAKRTAAEGAWSKASRRYPI